jgi:predicted aconitase with swiveling domain
MTELRLTEALSFWGGLDPETGRIIDTHHPQCGESIVGKTLRMERTRGSTSSPGTLVEAIRLGNAPKVIILSRPDMAVLSAVRIAELLYGVVVGLRIEEDD